MRCRGIETPRHRYFRYLARLVANTRKYLRSLLRTAVADSVITEAERQDLESVCDLFGLDRSALDSALRDAHAEAEGALSIALARSPYGLLRSSPDGKEGTEDDVKSWE